MSDTPNIAIECVSHSRSQIFHEIQRLMWLYLTSNFQKTLQITELTLLNNISLCRSLHKYPYTIANSSTICFSKSLYIVFSECCNSVRNLIFLRYIAKDTKQLKNVIPSLTISYDFNANINTVFARLSIYDCLYCILYRLCVRVITCGKHTANKRHSPDDNSWIFDVGFTLNQPQLFLRCCWGFSRPGQCCNTTTSFCHSTSQPT